MAAEIGAARRVERSGTTDNNGHHRPQEGAMSSLYAPLLALSLALATPAAAGPPSRAHKAAPQRSGLQHPEDLLPASPKDLLSDKAHSILKRLVAATLDADPDRPELLHRLARHARARMQRAGRAARALSETIAAAGMIRRRALLRKQRGLNAEARTWQMNAVQAYLKIAVNPRHASYARSDEVLFNLASLLLRAGQLKQGRSFFVRLIRNYPQSRQIPAAYAAFADHYFEQGKLPEALKLYQWVTKYPKSALYGYAIYKQAWCWLNLSDHRRALEAFVKVIRGASRWTGLPTAARERLVHEARLDAVIAFAGVGMPSKAYPFFKRIGGQEVQMMLERLAQVYADQGKHRAAAATYRRLMLLSPGSSALCGWQLGIFHAALAGQGRRAQVIEARRLAAVYRAMQRRAGPSKAAAACRGRVLGALRELSAALHAETAKGAPALRTLAGHVDRELDALRKP